jgi:hypothetical protein
MVLSTVHPLLSSPPLQSDVLIFGMDWRPIITAPWECDVELAVVDPDGSVRALAFPCRRTFGGWLNAETRKQVDVRPTHWQNWQDRFSPPRP